MNTSFNVGDKLEVMHYGGILESWHQVGSIVTVKEVHNNRISSLEENPGSTRYIHQDNWYIHTNENDMYENILI